MYDQKQFNQLLHDPTTKIYYLPYVDVDIPSNDVANVDRLSQTRNQLATLQAQYQNTQVGLAYLNSDLNWEQINAAVDNYPHLLTTDQYGVQCDLNRIQELLTTNPIVSKFTEHEYSEGNVLYEQVMAHQYQNVNDHFFVFTIFYDHTQTPTITIHSTALFNSAAFESANANQNGFTNSYLDKQTHMFVNQPFQFHNSFFGIDDQTCLETITHHMIDQQRTIYQKIVQIDPKIKNTPVADTYFDHEFINNIFTHLINDNADNLYPMIFADLLMPYDQQNHRINLNPVSWLAKNLAPQLTSLPDNQQQAVLFQLANLIFNGSPHYYQHIDETVLANIHQPFLDPSSINDHLIATKHLVIDNHIADTLPVMNHNSFVQQLSQLDRETTLYQLDRLDTKDQPSPVQTVTIDLKRQAPQLQNTAWQIKSLNLEQIANYQTDFTINWDFNHLGQTSQIMQIVGYVKIPTNKLDHVLKTLTAQLKQDHHYNFVINVFSFASQITNVIIQSRVQTNQFNFVILPTRLLNSQNQFQYQLPQTNLTTLQTIQLDAIENYDSHHTQINDQLSQPSYEDYLAIQFKALANHTFDNNSHKDRIRINTKAVKIDPHYQKFITQL